jgi:hypothetical protein
LNKVAILSVLLICLVFEKAQSQGATGFINFKSGAGVSFIVHSLHRVTNGMTLPDYSIISLEFEDDASLPDYTGFALYVNATRTDIEGMTHTLPLSKIKMTCTGTGNFNATYVSDTSEVEAKLSISDTPICYWKPGVGTLGSDIIKITYYIESLTGQKSDYYDVDIRFQLKAYDTVDP